MNKISVMQRALGPAWTALPPALKNHYQHAEHYDEGRLDIDYPGYLHPFFILLNSFGALVDRRGSNVPTRVEKKMRGDNQYWARTIRFPDGKVVIFNSRWVHEAGNRLIEFVNPFLGLRMAVRVESGELHYESINYVFQLWSLRLSIPEWLMLGKASIVESALDERRFVMDFRLRQPLLGQIFSYSGQFSTVPAVSPGNATDLQD
ncbi:hypothetical protein SKTS_15680 [Sulfurimicrobium lacus]|uniref:DUF4166 domain-containing protein n=1 Tax=Sulfurimicrobium lacus TaxID=2715678 RepID=A0A6F8VCJ5_9PROT|nr:DUF4166 domain-containing protein [Sulfurimicrobium lacus]BCB26682.1 hypothetical protein SKTS_15680 [Sulfurimicrobium lacus]